ncbi:MAG: hypothetical protein KAV87_40630 [Desulfobacteraceae bacterium]|nr:hypothetical protein [Desulfobacteraceae bacterium]
MFKKQQDEHLKPVLRVSKSETSLVVAFQLPVRIEFFGGHQCSSGLRDKRTTILLTASAERLLRIIDYCNLPIRVSSLKILEVNFPLGNLHSNLTKISFQ